MSSFGLSVAIVGLPNVGKSTLFNALLKKQVALAANYPFATIEPNVGVVEVPDERLPVLAKLVHTEVIKPALVEFIDIAGLVRGASQGEGLGNKFLAHIRETDAICHVLRAFHDDNVSRQGLVSPVEDLATIRTELQLADLETVNKQKQTKGTNDRSEQERWQIILDFKKRLEAGQNVLPASWLSMSKSELSPRQKSSLKLAKELSLLTYKPELFVLNIDEAELSKTELSRAELSKTELSKAELNEAELSKTEAVCQEYATVLTTSTQPIHQEQIVVISAKIESELAALSPEDQLLYMQELGIKQSGLERLARVAYQHLHLQSFLTAGELEVRAWTIKQGMTAVEASGVIHTDFKDKFIKARVVSFNEFVKYKGWLGCKEKGKLRLEGRDYVMQPDDVVEFMIGG